MVAAGTAAVVGRGDQHACVASGPPTTNTYGATPTPVPGPPASAWQHGRWSTLPPAPVAFGVQSRAFWVDGRMVVVQPAGSAHADAGASVPPGSWEGALFDPTTSTWTRLPRLPGELGSYPGVAAVGDRLLLWGGGRSRKVAGQIETKPVRRVFVLDPAAVTWHQVAPPPAQATYAPLSTWSGSRLFVVGDDGTSGADGAVVSSYDPVADSWSTGAATAAETAGARPSQALWTGTSLLVWFDLAPVADGEGWQHLERYDPGTDTWHPLRDDTRPAVADVEMRGATVVAREVATPCGLCRWYSQGRVVRIDPRDGSWSAGPPAPEASVPTAPGGATLPGAGPVDPGGRQVVVGGVAVRLGAIVPRGDTFLGVGSPDPRAVGLWVEDAGSDRWLVGTPTDRSLIVAEGEAGLAAGSPQLMWTGRSLIAWGTSGCSTSEDCVADVRSPVGLVYTPTK